MSKPDRNFYSIHGDDTGNIYQGDTLLFAAGDYSKPREIYLGDLIPPNPGEWADPLKLSGVKDLIVNVGIVQGCTEDVLDINHCENVSVYIEKGIIYGRFFATIKGGSRNIRVYVAELHGKGEETEFDIGNWSDQSMERTTNVSLFAQRVHGDHRPIRCRVLHAWVPTLDGGPWKVNKFMKGWFGFAYGLLKKLLRLFRR